MCLLVLAWNAHPRYRLIFAGNRDEFHDRPAAPMHWWPEQPGLLGGRDLKAGGTWLALSKTGRFGVVTNFRDLQASPAGAPSRGALLTRYFDAEIGDEQFVAELAAEASRYAGFNLLLADTDSFTYASNRAPQFARQLSAGVYGLSNHLLDTPWPKLEITRARFQHLISDPQPSAELLLDMLHDPEPATARPASRDTAPQSALHPAGLTPEWERLLSAPFIVSPRYGTRCSTIVLIEHDGQVLARERRFDPQGRTTGDDGFKFDSPQAR